MVLESFTKTSRCYLLGSNYLFLVKDSITSDSGLGLLVVIFYHFDKLGTTMNMLIGMAEKVAFGMSSIHKKYYLIGKQNYV
jgi:hypothetical protein